MVDIRQDVPLPRTLADPVVGIAGAETALQLGEASVEDSTGKDPYQQLFIKIDTHFPIPSRAIEETPRWARLTSCQGIPERRPSQQRR